MLQIPNPLFDLAGLTCGHYLIPFWTFFGATLVGKAVVKMHIQQLAVIIAFNEELLDKVIGLLALIPVIGSKFQEPLKRYLVEQKRKLHDKSSIVSKKKNNLFLIYTKLIRFWLDRITLKPQLFFNCRKVQRRFLGCLTNLLC